MFVTAIGLFALLAFSTEAKAQEEEPWDSTQYLYVYGDVLEHLTSEPITTVRASAWRGGEMLSTTDLDSVASFEVYLDYGFEYEIRFDAPGHVSKFVVIDTRNVPEYERSGGHELDASVTLFDTVPGFDFSILQREPIDKAAWDSTASEMVWDWPHRKRMVEDLNAIRQGYGGVIEAPYVYVYGAVMTYGLYDHQVLPGAKVSAWQGKEPLDVIYTDSLGEYELSFDHGYECLIRYEAPGKVSKFITIDTRNIPADMQLGYEMEADVILFGPVPDADVSVLEREPIDKAAFNTATKEMVWDTAHHERMRNALNKIREGYGGARNAVDNVYVFGKVKDYLALTKLTDVKVSVYVGPKLWATMNTDTAGRYEFNLDYDQKYVIRFEAPGLVSKWITIDARNIPAKERLGGHGMNVEMTLFEPIPGVDFSILEKEPIGKAKFNTATNEITWDLQHTEGIRSRISAIMRDYENQKHAAPATPRR